MPPHRLRHAATVRAKDESGIALLVVLLVITLLTVIVVEFTYSAQVETHLAFSGRNALQATYLARSGVNMAEVVLLLDKNIKTGGDVDSAHDKWAQPMPPEVVGDGTVSLEVTDENGKLNLNDLLTDSGTLREPGRTVARNLFDVLHIDRAVLHAIFDWMDRDGIPQVEPAGREGPFYLQQSPPIRIRNGPLVTLGELRLVYGVTPSVLKSLEGLVTVLPRQGPMKINLNTAPAEVLLALTKDPGAVTRLIERREHEPLLGSGDLRTVAGFDEATGREATREVLDYKSTYFRITSVGVVADTARAVVATVERPDGKRIKRVAWATNIASPTLTSQPASDFLRSLPAIGGD